MKQPWRRLAVSPSSDWTRLSLLTRGVGVELYRAADESGRISLGGEAPTQVVCRLLAAHPRERRRVAEAIDDMLRAGWLGVSGDALTVHVGDPEPTRSEPEASPKLTRSEPEADVKPARSEPDNRPNDAESFNGTPRALSEREDQIRSEKIRSDAGARDPELLPILVEHVYSEWRRLTGGLPGIGSARAVVECLTNRGANPRKVHDHAANVGLVLDAAEGDRRSWLTRAITGFAADPYAKSAGYRFELFATSPGSYALRASASTSAPDDFSHASTSTEAPF